MKNKVYYIKPINYNHDEALKDGINKALKIVQEKGYSNIKFIFSSLNLLDPPNTISNALEVIFGKGIELTKKLKAERGFPINNFPENGQTTGVNAVLVNSSQGFPNNETVAVLIWSAHDDFLKVQSKLFRTEIDLIAIVYSDDPEVDELLSASNGVNISNTLDPNISPYINNFSQEINDILNRLKSINKTDPASHTPTKERMKTVVSELKKNNATVPFVDFLGFLVNEVKFEIKESVALLNFHKSYFGR